ARRTVSLPSPGPVIATAAPPALPSTPGALPSAAPPREAPLPASTGGAPAAATNAPLPPLRLPSSFIGPRVPVRGPQWKRGALPAFSPEVLRAMMDPRAARRAQRLRRLG